MVKHRSKLKRGKTSKRSRGRKVKGISSKQNLDTIVKSLSERYGTPIPIPTPYTSEEPFLLLQNYNPVYEFNPQLNKILTDAGKLNKYFFKACRKGNGAMYFGLSKDLMTIKHDILDVNLTNIERKNEVLMSIHNLSEKKRRPSSEPRIFDYRLFERTYDIVNDADIEGYTSPIKQISKEPVDLSLDGVNGVYISIEVIDINALISLSPTLKTKSKVYDTICWWNYDKIVLNSNTKSELIKNAKNADMEDLLDLLIQDWENTKSFKENIFIFNLILIENERIAIDKLFLGNPIRFSEFLGRSGDSIIDSDQNTTPFCIWGDSNKKNVFEIKYNFPLFLTYYDLSKLISKTKTKTKKTKKLRKMKLRKMNPVTGSFGSFSTTSSMSDVVM